MPIIKSAKKKLRQDRKRTIRNNFYKKEIKKLIKEAKKQKSLKVLTKAYSKIDKAVKKGVVHKKKASRLKSMIAKFINKK